MKLKNALRRKLWYWIGGTSFVGIVIATAILLLIEHENTTLMRSLAEKAQQADELLISKSTAKPNTLPLHYAEFSGSKSFEITKHSFDPKQKVFWETLAEKKLAEDNRHYEALSLSWVKFISEDLVTFGMARIKLIIQDANGNELHNDEGKGPLQVMVTLTGDLSASETRAKLIEMLDHISRRLPNRGEKSDDDGIDFKSLPRDGTRPRPR